MAIADIDNDIDLDILFTSNGGSTLTWYEQTQKTDLLNPDSDSDGLLDGVETETGVFNSVSDTGTDPSNPDSDNDGFNDGEETSAGSDPNDPNSIPTEPVQIPIPHAMILLLGLLFTAIKLKSMRKRQV